ncbi:uncharacterized protein LOC110806538 [Carica papaya]|uniref:uncharacterized protein LOC110806538 n=1 Tax=Carica papaya TaxID=3649 RepID=UPI000B8CD652|nr:uncharacterized protein LOC110806538 [Carica papaya]
MVTDEVETVTFSKRRMGCQEASSCASSARCCQWRNSSTWSRFQGLEEEKKMKKEGGCTSEEGEYCWWDQEIERMSLEELEKYEEAINALREKVGKRAEEMADDQPSSLH